jgi:hypothetical protein
MKKLTLILAIAMLVISVTTVFAATALFGSPQPTYPTSFKGVTPTEYSGNFVSSDDDQVCFDMSALGYIGEVTEDMRGFKIDPPVDYSDGNIDVILNGNGRYLAWAAESNATVLAFIIKGGPNYHVYDYVGSGFESDSWLASPLTNRGSIPQISHYNVCYTLTPGVFQGCTRGYWANHADRWLGVSEVDDFDLTFDVNAFNPDITLGQAIKLTAGGLNQLAAQGTAALLNSYGGVPNSDGTFVTPYKYTTQEVLGLVKDAIDSGDEDEIERVKDLLDAANNAGCPLSGTRAVPVQ